MANETGKLFANAEAPVSTPKKAVQPEATTQEPVNTAEAVAEQNKQADAHEGKTKTVSEPTGPAPVVPVPTTVHATAQQPTTETNLATTNVVAESGVDDKPNDLPSPDRLSMLKKRADLMGITYSNNIGLEALQQKIQKQLDDENNEIEKKASDEPAFEHTEKNVTGLDPQIASVSPLTNGSKSKKLNLRQYLFNEKMKLVRLRITNLDPKKADLNGEFFTIANEYLGTVKKFIPYGEVTDNGWHVPYCLYELLRDKQFVSIKTRKDKQTGQQIVEHQMVKEFALEVLPPLSTEELAKLAATQQMNGSIEN